jgi:TolB-like protein/Tfp pilus assembly protein PilF
MKAQGKLTIRLLGAVAVQAADGRDVTPPGKKLRALLACLALGNEKGWARERLCALLWNDRAEEQARASLRQALAELRRIIGEPSFLKSERDHVALDPACIAVDVSEFGRLAAAGQLEQAASLYRGDLMDGQTSSDAEFAAWLAVERTKLHDLAIGVLTKLTETQTGESAIATVHRMLQLDPAREESHRMLMRRYAASGRRAQGLRQYQICRDILQRDLDASPEPETESLLKQLQSSSNGTTADEAVVAGKPSIAVLPFTNLSGDPEQQYFSNGVTEDIITELSRFRQLVVIARNSAFQFSSSTVDLGDIQKKLGIQYVVEGSVRRGGDIVRITAQLIDASTGNHLWAENYDRKSEEVFAVQDEVVRAIAATIEGRLVPSGAERALRKPTFHMSAYDYLLQGREHWNHYDAAAAEVPLRRAIELDPKYAQAHAWLGFSLLLKEYDYCDEMQLQPALACAQKAIALDPDDSTTQAMLGLILTYMGKHDAAAAHFERAVVLHPNNMFAQTLYGALLIYIGRPDAALVRLELVLQRDPYPPVWYWEWSGLALYQLRRYDEATAAFHKMGLRHYWTHAYLAASYAMAGRFEDASEHKAAYCNEAHDASVHKWAMYDPYKDQRSLEHLLEGLRKAGLPE